MPPPSWGEGNEQGGVAVEGNWNNEAVGLSAGGDVPPAKDHGFDVGVKPELYPDFEPERQKIKDAGWVESTPYNYEVVDKGDPNGVLRDWAGNAKVYEWNGEEGDVGPESEELERELFGDPDKRSGSGIDFSTQVPPSPESTVSNTH